MMRPTDEDLNLLMAQTLGYRSAGKTGMFSILVLRPGTDQPVAPPDFCNDRNKLPEVWNLLESSSRLWSWFQAMEALIGCNYREEYEMMKSTPRMQTVGALKALGQWPDNWSED